MTQEFSNTDGEFMAYDDKRNYPKIDIFKDGLYVASTTWASNCAVAKERYIESLKREGNLPTDRSTIQTFFAKE